MIRSFWFVTSRSFKNRILQRLRRLRQPRYLISFIAGLAYLWFIFLRRMFMGPRRVGFGISGLPVSDVAVDVMAIFALIGLLFAWAWPEEGGGLTFSQAEIQFLFPAPVSRRQLLLYKVFRQQPQILISAAMMTLFGFRQAKFIGLWIPFVMLAMYFTMVGLARARLKLMGIGFLARLAAVLMIAGGLFIIFKRTFDNASLASLNVKSYASLFRAADSPLHAPIINVILFIPRLFATAALPKTLGQQFVSCAGLIILAVIFYFLAAQLNVSFEEASVRASERQTARLARIRGQRFGRRVLLRRMPPPFRLSGASYPELAIVWKNLIAALRISVLWVFVLAFILSALIVPNVFSHEKFFHGVGAIMALCFCAAFPFVGSNMFNQDMRLDLPDFELLKSFPLTGERLVAAEIAGPLMILSSIQTILLSIASIMVYRSDVTGKLAFFGTPEFVVVALLFTIPICAAQLVIRNAMVILLPGWSIRSPEESRGFVVLGQRLVMLLGNAIILAISLIPAALIFLPAFFLSHRYFAGSAAVLAIATVPSAALLAVEVWMAIKFLGAQFDRIDVTTEVGVATI